MERVVVVGGGVLGMMHALEARQRGYHVVHLEREPVPRGARLRIQVRDAGLVGEGERICLSAQERERERPSRKPVSKTEQSRLLLWPALRRPCTARRRARAL